MKQYLSVKERYRDEILFFRMGDFYEMFFDDAKDASEILGIALLFHGFLVLLLPGVLIFFVGGGGDAHPGQEQEDGQEAGEGGRHDR